jgi:hypothetical protein
MIIRIREMAVETRNKKVRYIIFIIYFQGIRKIREDIERNNIVRGGKQNNKKQQ